MTFPYSGLKSLLIYIKYVIKYGKAKYSFTMYCIFCVIRLAGVDFYAFVISKYQSHCCIEKMKKVFGKFFVQLAYIFSCLIIVNNEKGIKYFLLYNGLCWN
jgi:hypothetical protein